MTGTNSPARCGRVDAPGRDRQHRPAEDGSRRPRGRGAALAGRAPGPQRHERAEHERDRQEVGAGQHRRAERAARRPRTATPCPRRAATTNSRKASVSAERPQRLGDLLARGEDQRRVERRRAPPPRRPPTRPASSAAMPERRQRRRRARPAPAASTRPGCRTSRALAASGASAWPAANSIGAPGGQCSGSLSAVAVGVLVGDPDRELAVGALVGGLVARRRVLGPVGVEGERAGEHRRAAPGSARRGILSSTAGTAAPRAPAGGPPRRA